MLQRGARHRHLSLEQLEGRRLLSNLPHLLADLNPATESVRAWTAPVRVGDSVYYVSDVPGASGGYSSGWQLWKSDGTPGSAVLLAQVNLGPGDYAFPGLGALTSYGGYLFFSASDGVSGTELWRSDGTPEGTHMVADINPGPGSGVPTWKALTVVGDRLFFAANDGSCGEELWALDSPTAAPRMVKDINPESYYSSNPHLLTDVGGTALAFFAFRPAEGNELWTSDGTEAGTVLVKDINPGFLGSLYTSTSMVDVNGTLYFAADDGDHGNELWKSNLTPEGTVLVDDINASGSSNPYSLVNVNGVLLFGADNGVHGCELWRSGGDPINTWMVADINPDGNGLPPARPPIIADVGGTAAFIANDGTPGLGPLAGYELWKSSAPFTDAELVQDINPGIGSSLRYDCYLTSHEDPVSHEWKLYFAADDGLSGKELWESDLTAPGTRQIKDVFPGFPGSSPKGLVFVGDELAFLANDGMHGDELWWSDLTEAGTYLVADVNQDPGGSYPYSMSGLGGDALFMNAQVCTTLWKTSGTAPSTYPLTGLGDPGYWGRFAISPTPLSRPGQSDLVFFSADTPLGCELWETDGTPGGTFPIMDIMAGPDSSNPDSFTVSGDWCYFVADDGIHGRELWKTNGAVTEMVKDIEPGPGWSSPQKLIDVGGTLFFVAGTSAAGWEVWKSDGSEDGTVLVKDINPGWYSPDDLTAAGGVLYFVGDDGVHGSELWRTDGTPEGTWMVKDIDPAGWGLEQMNSGLTYANGLLYFVGNDGLSGRELWRSDGTPEGTWMVADINPDGDGFPGDPMELPAFAALNNEIFFRADDGRGRALWKSDGSEAGTTLVKEILPSFKTWSEYGVKYAVLGGELYFAGDDGNGPELWRTDGTPEGTVLVDDIWPGGGGSFPHSLASIGGKLYFAANDRVHGIEPWVLDPGEPASDDLGDLTFDQRAHQNPAPAGAAGLWYRFRPALPAALTVLATFTGQADDVQLTLCDATRTPIPLPPPMGGEGWQRIDFPPMTGETYYVRLTGVADDVELRFVNQMQFNGSNFVNVFGSPKDDSLRFDYNVPDGSHHVRINEVDYGFPAVPGFNVFFDAADGWDTAEVFGSPNDDWVTLSPGGGNINSWDYGVGLQDVQQVTVHGMGGNNAARLNGSTGNDSLFADPNAATLSDGPGTGHDNYINAVLGFSNVRAYSVGGRDNAVLTGSDGNDWFWGKPGYATLSGGWYYLETNGFAFTQAIGTPGGNDWAALYGSSDDDLFYAEPAFAFLQSTNAAGDSRTNRVDNFRNVTAYAVSGGHDWAAFAPSPGQDFFTATPANACMSGPGYVNRAVGFGETYARGSDDGGDDSARLYDSAGDDHLDASPNHAFLSGSRFRSQVDGFRTINVYATAGGNDTAALAGSSGDDTFDAWPKDAFLRDGSDDLTATYRIRVSRFDFVGVQGGGGKDTATLHDSPGDDEFHAWPTFAFLQGPGFTNRVDNFSSVTASAALGHDVARLFGSPGTDDIPSADPKKPTPAFVASPTEATFRSTAFSNTAQYFDEVYADSMGGKDTAILSDSPGKDWFEAGPNVAKLFSGQFFLQAANFASVIAKSSGGGDVATLTGSTGKDTFTADFTEKSKEKTKYGTPTANSVYWSSLVGPNFSLREEGFAEVVFVAVQSWDSKGRYLDRDAVNLWASGLGDSLEAGSNSVADKRRWAKLTYKNGRTIELRNMPKNTTVTATTPKKPVTQDKVHEEAHDYVLKLKGKWKRV
jgi:ELWxxDGT repeat protein